MLSNRATSDNCPMLAIPQNIFENIFGYLSFQEICRCSRLVPLSVTCMLTVELHILEYASSGGGLFGALFILSPFLDQLLCAMMYFLPSHRYKFSSIV
jgi:hypothetical protein